ncbi:hypothetical protein [Qipengyuania atrilutea]|uniref:Uncharacterized protein n=1 Tax=Qipengyuania atrilutea TaxID=2744473 RepID=A0A850H3R4_9SPHN|nr:hypothetical protein [Actirhodobacter atriluteus]NVD44842.1 hypothetical protein [Actirhodobacter atriluteus]
MTNEERIARYEELKAQGASLAQLKEVCQLDRSVAARQPKKKRGKYILTLTIEQAQKAMKADLKAGIPVNGWPV